MIRVARPVHNAAKAWPATASNDNKGKARICATAMATTTRARPVRHQGPRARPVFVLRIRYEQNKGEARNGNDNNAKARSRMKTTGAMPVPATIATAGRVIARS